MKQKVLFGMLAILLAVGCKTTKTVIKEKQDDGKITFKFIQVNDVYEIAPLNGGKYGGMARVAHVADSIKKENKNTFLVMAGDFLNPSLLGTVKVDGERVAGRQMIEVMNAMNFDLVTFGNHEFDVSEEQLQKRLNESNFQWISSNTYHKKEGEAVPFVSQKGEVAYTYTFEISDADGTTAKIGFFSCTIDSNPKDFVYYGDYLEYAVNAVEDIKNQGAIPFGLTHLEIEQDTEIAQAIDSIPLIMGGHEHTNMDIPVNGTHITKADANTKSVYVHTVTYDVNLKKWSIASQLVPIDETISSDPEVEKIVDRWTVILEEKIKEVISDPYEIIYHADPPLNGLDAPSRSVQTNLGTIITHAMAESFNTEIDAAIVNGGSIRVDDMLSGDITSLDVFRVLPFGGYVVKVDVTGTLLKEILDYGKKSAGTGAYLQHYNIEEAPDGSWLVQGKPINTEKAYYTIAMSDFLLKGLDIPFLTPENSGVLKIYEPETDEPAYDVRKAVIVFLKN